MKRLMLMATVAWLLSSPLLAAEEETCGQELAGAAVVPEKLSQLILHVATNMETHARWVGVGDAGAKREHDGMMQVAKHYRELAAAAKRAEAAMKAMKDVPAAKHDPKKLNADAQADWMEKKIKMQKEFAQLLLDHAAVSEKHLTQMRKKK